MEDVRAFRSDGLSSSSASSSARSSGASAPEVGFLVEDKKKSSSLPRPEPCMRLSSSVSVAEILVDERDAALVSNVVALVA